MKTEITIHTMKAEGDGHSFRFGNTADFMEAGFLEDSKTRL